MRGTFFLILPSILAAVDAISIPWVAPRDGGGSSCPAVWKNVKAELQTKFVSGGQCNAMARAAIRAVFHDCGSWDTSQGFHGGCDGSLVLGVTPDIELNRPENNGLQSIAAYYKDAASRFKTTVADMVVFGGSFAIKACPGGPTLKTFVGRKDSTTSAKPGGLPDVHDTAANLNNLFARKGYSQADLAALLGAHSTSTQQFVNTSVAGFSQDSTPGQWDVTYYSETLKFAQTGSAPAKVFVFPSDAKLATFQDVGKNFQGFVGHQSKWQSAFQNAMQKMILFGNNPNGMADCTNSLS